MGHPSNAATGAIVATYIAGEALGALIQMLIGDKLGRKRFMQLMCIVVRHWLFPLSSSSELERSFLGYRGDSHTDGGTKFWNVLSWPDHHWGCSVSS